MDRLLIGPPGVVTINTKHHRAGRVELDGEQLVLNGHPTRYVPKARREAERVTAFLHAALAATDDAAAGRVAVRPMIVVVGGRLLIRSWAGGVTVVMARQLLHALHSMSATLTAGQVHEVFEVARRSTTWLPTRHEPR